MPCFSRYGKLATGLQRLKLSSASLETNQNLGLWPLSRRNDREDDTIDYDDPVWEASRVLHTLERFEERGRATPTTERVSAFGEPESVPWLDALEKERAREVLADALSESSGVSQYSWGVSCLFTFFAINGFSKLVAALIIATAIVV